MKLMSNKKLNSIVSGINRSLPASNSFNDDANLRRGKHNETPLDLDNIKELSEM